MWDRTADQIELYLIRHGMTAGNAAHRYIGGRTDEPLSEEGKRQLEQADKMPQVSRLFVSPMLRCRQTAQILFPGQLQVELDLWREMDFGAFEGKNYAELNGDPRYQAWIDSGGTLAFPDGEDREAFVARCVEGMEWMMQDLQQSQAACPVAAVVHGGTIMALLSHYCGGDYFSYQVKNGAGYHLRLHLREKRMELIEQV